ncbi:Peroxisome size and maintenance regulator [Komagataella phaffii CBS 7435]|uniref:Peroxisome size and maintenance regulator n=1 Tax=Komagataella phaffii (strain ATCC 76273 / CBS 7435 / CECT 11047 / NRRL Y-11430 / Wegner 21-1) TaxID=981350 RepID=A0A1G4KQ96_KOMPC|nr:GQ67_03993T0 [Komagataella phaffii]CAH2449257.1 Peroxisome size and maintenance regulator [Komagataella phaffii CBS 7435]SCV12182.1 Peroxisome size and maintenance regulator [Komagataella phaffii CBS 7435]
MVSKRELLKSKTKAVLASTLEYTSEYAADSLVKGSKRGLAAGTAASLMELGLDKWEGGSSSRKLPASSTVNTELDDDAEHFVDKLVDKLLRHTVTKRERQLLKSKMQDPVRKDQPRLSIKVMMENLRTLSAHLELVFTIQHGISRVIKWHCPSMTITYLLLYTWAVISPYMFLVYMLVFLTYGVVVQKYLERHPIEPLNLVDTPNRISGSLLDFLAPSEFTDPMSGELYESIREEVLSQEQEDHSDAESIVSISESVEEVVEETESGKTFNKEMNILINMRDLQNLLSHLTTQIEFIEQYCHENFSFQDEKLSTSLFLKFWLWMILLFCFGRYIPWKAIFIVSGWVAVCRCHPSFHKLGVLFLLLPENWDSGKAKPVPDSESNKAEYKSLILDEEPEIRTVEVFELQQNGLTPSQYVPICFTTTIFHQRSNLRRHQKKPKGSILLNEVQAPKEWTFSIEGWTLDTDPKKWCYDRNLIDGVVFKNDEWCYDLNNQFRRRRWVRECFRYARPVPE